MNLNHLLLWIVGMSCSTILLRASSSLFRGNRGWTAIALTVLGVTLFAWFLLPAQAGLLGGSLWLLLIFLPTLLMQQVSRLASQESFQAAAQLAIWVRWLHPLDGWMEYPSVLRSLALAQRGKTEQAIALLEQFQTSVTPIGRIAAAAQYRIEARWDGLLDWIHSHGLEQWLIQDANLSLVHLRSLGETGEINGLVQAVQRLTPTLERTGSRRTLHQTRLLALAFCGQTAQVRELLEQSLTSYPLSLKQFWLATADWAAGHSSTAIAQLQALQPHADAITQRAIAYRLAHPPMVAATALTESSQAILAEIKTDLWQNNRYGNPFTFVSRCAYITYGLMAINVLLFMQSGEISDRQNPDLLFHLGALVAPLVWQGQWWRLLTANFLHLNILHLGMNMLGLYFLGGFVESRLGRVRFLLAYLGSGIGTMAVLTLLTKYNVIAPQILVGASAAVMGLVGVLAAILLYGWRREGSRVAAKNFRLMLSVLMVQTLFDLTTPGISFAGHAVGFLLGSLLGQLLLFRGLNEG